MKSLLLLVFLSCCYHGLTQTKPERITLPNGWSLSPVGRSLKAGDLPLNIVISPKGNYMAVINSGYGTQTIQLFSPSAEKLLDSVIIPKSWYGLAFSTNEKFLYASGGNDNIIWQYAISKSKLVLNDSFVLGKKWPVRISPSGIAISEKRNKLYVLTKESNQLLVIDIATHAIANSIDLGGEGYTCILSPDESVLYASCWGCDKIKLFDTEKNEWTGEIGTGDNPNEIILTKNGRYLFVANANDNSVSVIDTKTKSVIETLNAAVSPAALPGSTTNGLALNTKETVLYIANADNNNLAVYDVSHPGDSKARGFIPTGWYPTSVRHYKNKLFVANGKGFTSMANPYGPNPLGKKQWVAHHAGDSLMQMKVQHIGGLFTGTISIIPEPSAEKLKQYTQMAYKNIPSPSDPQKMHAGNPLATGSSATNPIRYIFYVIKENRTYDQVLADMKGGNGDTSLLLFGKNITPNLHQLAEQFVLLDNFYVNAEVSSDGHNWTMGGYATDYLEKTWPTSYGGRGGRYDGEGNRSIANNKGGFIWDHCNRAGISFRTYGEFADDYKPNLPVLRDHMAPRYTGFNMSVKDTTRFAQWKEDFDSLLASGNLPRLSTIRMGNDHTEGVRKGKPTPYAHVADNDYAVGLLVEYLAKSPIWNESVILVVEDDAQNGADHVDAHRSTAYVAGGLVKRNFVDHTSYTTASFLRTIEMILGMGAMSQYDQAAVPLYNCFNTTAAPSSFTAIVPLIDLNEKNTAMNEWQKRSEKYDLAKEDNNPDLEFNLVLWHAIKGDRPFPGPTRAAFLTAISTDEDD